MINYSEIQSRINSGLITSRKHPFLPLEILNYTQKTQFEKLWDPYTRMCRGLILDSEHNIVARPFPKFFNLNETPETTIRNLPNEIPTFTEKFDGSLGLLFPENIEPAIATRGSFESQQAIWATDWIRKKEYSIEDFKSNYTYLFEIIAPISKNVVSYTTEDLILLAVISNKDGSEIDHEKEAISLGFSYAKSYPFDEIETAIGWLEQFKGTEKEGLVCKYSNGLRVKIKSEDYRRLHKILSGFTEKDIWEHMSSGKSKSLDDFINLVPDEFYQWIKDTEKDITEKYNKILNEATLLSNTVQKLPLPSRKDQANYVLYHTKDKPKGFSGVVFSILDNNTEKAKQQIWNIVKP